MADQGPDQTVIIEAPSDNGAAAVAESAADQAADAATLSAVAAGVSAASANESEAAAESATGAAVAADDAASEAEMTLQGLADLIQKLPERLAQAQQQQATPPVVEEVPKEEVPKEEKPKKLKPESDTRPEVGHWFYKKRSRK